MQALQVKRFRDGQLPAPTVAADGEGRTFHLPAISAELAAPTPATRQPPHPAPLHPPTPPATTPPRPPPATATAHGPTPAHSTSRGAAPGAEPDAVATVSGPAAAADPAAAAARSCVQSSATLGAVPRPVPACSCASSDA